MVTSVAAWQGGMYHDPLLARAAADPRPASAVSAGAGLAGLAGTIVWIALARTVGMDGPYAALCNLLACGLPMIGWSLLVDRVHRRPSTGIDWTRARTWREARETGLVKLAGLFATWAAIALVYGTLRFYWQGNYAFSMWCLAHAAPVVAVLGVPYVLWLDRYLVEPRDGAWHLGAWLCGMPGVEPAAIHAHLRSWAVKGFFLAFMLAIVPAGFGDFVRRDTAGIWRDPIALTGWLVTFMFVLDVAFATVGYICTLRPLDSHIRSANPYAAAWTAALICYPPFVLMGNGGAAGLSSGNQRLDALVRHAPVAAVAGGAVPRCPDRGLCRRDGRVRAALLQPDAPRHHHARAVCVVAAPGLSVEEPVLVAVDGAGAGAWAAGSMRPARR